MADFKETCCEFLNVDNHATFCSSESKWINKIMKLKEQRPDDVIITMYPENNNGYIVAHVPKNWFKLSPPRKREMTDEQKEAMTQRLAEARAKRNG